MYKKVSVKSYNYYTLIYLLTAKQAIKTCSGPLLKLRPIREGIPESKEKARCFRGKSDTVFSVEKF